MTTFDQREKGEERKFVHDEEAHFRARARRDRLVGAWAAEKLGLKGVEAEAYAKGLVVTDLEQHGDADVIAKLQADFAAKKVDVSGPQIERILHEKMIEAEKQVKAGA
jgi:hypothetical protein